LGIRKQRIRILIVLIRISPSTSDNFESEGESEGGDALICVLDQFFENLLSREVLSYAVVCVLGWIGFDLKNLICSVLMRDGSA